LLDPSCATLVGVQPADFYILRHRWIWDAVLQAGPRGDLLTISDRLKKNGKLDEIGGIAYLTKLLNSTPTISHAEEYAKLVKEETTRRKYLELAEKIAKDAQNGSIDPTVYIDAITSSTAVLGGAEGIQRFTLEYERYVQKRQEDPRDVWGIPTGFIDFDRVTGGLHKKQVVMISGETGVGKTLFVIQAAVEAAKAGYKVVIYELEMDGKDLVGRVISGETKISTRRVHQGQLTEGDMFSIGSQVSAICDLPIWMSDETHWTTIGIRSDLSKIKSQHGADLVVVDYMNLLADKGGNSESENIELKCKGFRNICKDLDVAGLTVHSQIKTESTFRKTTDLRGSAEVGYAVDQVWFVTKDYNKPLVRLLETTKQRHGSDSDIFIKLVMNKDVPRLENYTGQGE